MKIVISIINSDPPSLKHSSKYSKDFKSFIKACLQKDPEKRATAEELLKHKFLQKAEDEDYLVDNFLAGVQDLKDRVDSSLQKLGDGKPTLHFGLSLTNSEFYLGHPNLKYNLASMPVWFWPRKKAFPITSLPNLIN